MYYRDMSSTDAHSEDPNELTCSTIDATVKLARAWADGDLHEGALGILRAWVRLRMQAYAQGGWEGEREPMVEWIAIDLAIDDEDAHRLCGEAGWLVVETRAKAHS